MAPTIHGKEQPSSSSAHLRSAGRGRDDKKLDLNVRLKYYNNLPDVPFEPKFLAYPFDQNRFIQYKPTSLERNHKWELLTETDLGVNVDLVNPDAYSVNISPNMISLDPIDEKLLEDEPVNAQDTKRSKQHSRAVSWMRKTEYISSEFNRLGTQNERKETKLGLNIKKQFKEEPLYKDRESQIAAIEKTFEDVKLPVTEHYSKPGVMAIQEMPLFPDFDVWKYPFAQVIFDADPAPVTLSPDIQTEQMSQALIRGMMDESGEQFVAYFLPTEETLQQRRRDTEEGVPYTPGQTYDYKLAREYNWTVKNKASKGYEENYFFVFRPDGVHYNELETRVRLSRRRAKDGIMKVANSRLLITHRELTEQEEAAQNSRLLQLQPIQEEDEQATATVDNYEHVDDEQQDADDDEKGTGSGVEEDGANAKEEDSDEDVASAHSGGGRGEDSSGEEESEAGQSDDS